MIIIIIIMVIFKCYFSGEHIALSINKSNNGENIELLMKIDEKIRRQSMFVYNFNL